MDVLYYQLDLSRSFNKNVSTRKVFDQNQNLQNQNLQNQNLQNQNLQNQNLQNQNRQNQNLQNQNLQNQNRQNQNQNQNRQNQNLQNQNLQNQNRQNQNRQNQNLQNQNQYQYQNLQNQNQNQNLQNQNQYQNLQNQNQYHYRQNQNQNQNLQNQIANSLFHDGVKKVHENDFSRCLSRMKDCYYPIEEAKRLSGKSEDEESEINVIQKDVYYTTCTAESIQAREMGSQLLDIAVKEEEVLDVEAIWDVIDWYTRAAILARELDLEQEAIALSRLGFVYNKVLKLKQRSKLYYKKSFELAESMKPRVFTMHDWYKHCVSTLQEFQMEERMWDESEKQKERDKKLEELKEEIADLKLHNKGKTSFLAYVYKTFPPKNPKFKKPEDDEMKKWEKIENDPSKAKELGKILLKGLTAYHPDKVDTEKHGEKWKTLSEEITKMLTAHYETTKLR
ncbi:hypothetical protein QZH41_005274 [Actinostola sp. cb2023]|nr:hypothetical protein QZH41_005274 [Actinostola sp. cb2023]